MKVRAEKLGKRFQYDWIFRNLSLTCEEGRHVAITGRNGSGKSTLAKILCGLLTPTRGRILCGIDNHDVSALSLHRHIGLVSPYINMYDEFSGMENLSLFGRIRNLRLATNDEPARLLRQFGIYERRNDDVRTYSSGMKQRLKYAAALLHRPELLILDEPTANLDEEGIATVQGVMRAQIEKGILVIATNDAGDLEFAGRRIDLNDSRTKNGKP